MRDLSLFVLYGRDYRVGPVEGAGFFLVLVDIPPGLAGEYRLPEVLVILIDYLSGILEVPKGNVQIVSGESSRMKTLRIAGFSLKEIREKLDAAML